MDSNRDDLLKAFHRTTRELKLCPNRIWAVAGEDLPKLLPDACSVVNVNSPEDDKDETDNDKDRHDSCTFDFCEYSQRDFTAVQQRHECSDPAKCSQLRNRFPRAALEKAIKHGGDSTVWNLAGTAILSAQRPFMAISHVWSDGTGTGAWGDGEVNVCLYDFFRNIAQQFQCEGIWWDTLCIPREKVTRNKAIKKIQRNYQDARITLVHDCFLRSWPWDPETACFAILMSPWFSRGWTALELANSRKVKVIFKGRRGLVIKDLDEEILAKDDEPDGPRKEASRIIQNLRKDVTSLNDLLRVLGPRYTSWPKDMSIISALLVGVVPEEQQQGTYRRILRKLGRISPGNLFHNSATMSSELSWCPTSLFNMPLDRSQSNGTLIISRSGVRGKWRIIPMNATLEENFIWSHSHPLIKRQLQDALQHPNQCRLLAECVDGPIEKALLVKETREALEFEYVGALHFRHVLNAQEVEDWAELEVTILNSVDNQNEARDYLDDKFTRSGTGAVNNGIQKLEEEEQMDEEIGKLRRAVWTGNYDAFSRIITKVHSDDTDTLGRRLLHLAAERGDVRMVEALLSTSDIETKSNDGQTALHYAAWGGSAAVVEILMRHGSETIAKDKFGNVALHVAAQMGFGTVAKLLIGNTPIDVEGHNNLTPLHYAIIYGHKEVVQYLLDQGAKVDVRDSKIGWSPLHFAAESGDQEIVRLLVGSGADVNQTDDKIGWGPLEVAVMNGHVEIFHFLVRNGANTKAKDVRGWTPRHFAEINGHLRLVEQLPSCGDISSIFQGKTKLTPLHSMALNGRSGLAKLLADPSSNIDLTHGEDTSCPREYRSSAPSGQIRWSPLLFATKNGLVTTVKRLLENGISLDVKDDTYRRSPLAWAALEGHKDVVALLLKHGANTEAEDKSRQTPLMLAAMKGHDTVVEILLKQGANIESEDQRRRVALSWAAGEGHNFVVDLLLKWDADIESMDVSWNTPLTLAAMNGHESVVETLLEHNANVKGSHGYAPLWWAARHGHGGSVELLLENGADIEASGEEYLTPLSRAAYEGHTTIVKILLEYGADIEATDTEYQTPLSHAAYKGHAEVIRLLLDEEANADGDDRASTTPLIHAARNGRKDVVELLLQNKANIQHTSRLGGSALWWAALDGHKDVVEFLLRNGASIDARSESGRTPLSEAAYWGHKEVVQLLLEEGADIETKDDNELKPLLLAAREGHVAVVELLLKRNAYIEARDKDGRTALSWAAYGGHVRVIELLLKKGASIETKDKNGCTPLWQAVQGNYGNAIDLLLGKGADLEARDNTGRTALSWLVGEYYDLAVAQLLQRGAIIETRDSDGQTPLSWAAAEGSERNIKVLLENGANIEAENCSGQTPLIRAVSKWRSDTVKLLLESGANIEARDKTGRTPLSWAASEGYYDSVNILLEKGADTNAKDSSGQTPLAWAIRENHEEVIELLTGLAPESGEEDDS
ncbi:hypothetical protein EIK77_004916 [Talaromyces pinophilus]|nr:hypothetical protein EIK77_004916 [Talaromyces pinophilus]PCH03294.1 Heterokaryon incompatibility [Penicillium occitanis (nom. inval.)]PCH09977.1 hypothetical protein PENOC_006160 [Penicillium occitanis (nom. inval.)]